MGDDTIMVVGLTLMMMMRCSVTTKRHVSALVFLGRSFWQFGKRIFDSRIDSESRNRLASTSRRCFGLLLSQSGKILVDCVMHSTEAYASYVRNVGGWPREREEPGWKETNDEDDDDKTSYYNIGFYY
jgi:hypothetical protein